MNSRAAQFQDDGESSHSEEIFPRRKPTWTFVDGLALIGVFIMTNLIVSVVASLVAGRGSIAAYVVPMATAPLFTLLLAYIGIRVRTPVDQSVASLLGFRIPDAGKALRAIPVVIGGGITLFLVIVAQNVVLKLVGLAPESIPEQPVIELLRKDPRMEIAAAITFFAVIVAPFSEEILFRGTLYLPLRSKIGPVYACIIVSVIFGAIHLYLWGFVYLFVVGLIFVILAETTRSLLVPIAAHAVHNALMVAALFAGLD